jgi:hypothetical protein
MNQIAFPGTHINLPMRDYRPACRSAAEIGLFSTSKVYNDDQMDSMSRIYGPDLYEVAGQEQVAWDRLSSSQQRGWMDWAARLGWKTTERTPDVVRVWRFSTVAAHYLSEGIQDQA